MPEQRTTGPTLPWGTMLALLFAGAGAFILLPQLDSSRPSLPTLTRLDTTRELDVPARLWQDPFKAVEDDLRTADAAKAGTARNEYSTRPLFGRTASEPAQRLSTEPADVNDVQRDRPHERHPWYHSIDKLTSDIRQFVHPPDDASLPAEDLLVLPVMVPGGPYAELMEERLRTRQAVSNGLAASGFVSDNPERIGYCWLSQWRFGDISVYAAAKPFRLLHDTAPNAREAVAIPIPYEWYFPTPLKIGSAPTTHPSATQSANPDPVASTAKAVLVLWLRDEDFYDVPLARLARLLELLNLPKPTHRKARVCVIGPSTSDSLRDMAAEANEYISHPEKAVEVKSLLRDVTLYAATPQAEDELLVNGLDNGQGKCVVTLLQNAVGGHFGAERLTATNDVLANTLIEELTRRGVDVRCSGRRDHIALVSEWDTYYGRSLPYTFGTKALAPNQRVQSILPGADGLPPFPYWIHRFSYLRGIDGKLPNDDKGSSAETKVAAAGDSGDRKTQDAVRGSATDNSEGYNQTDYLTRVARQLQQLDRRLVRENGEGLKAVGVLGSDLYDKLLVLKATRDLLPGAIFFTTNLDARYTHRLEWPEAHNLVVVASYGLALDPYYQCSIPPFRDTNQTAVYAATLTATGVLTFQREELRHPRIFEIGRAGAHDLSVDVREPTPLDPIPAGCIPADWSVGTRPNSLHPARPDMAGWWTGRRVFYVLSICRTVLIVVSVILANLWFQWSEFKKLFKTSIRKTLERFLTALLVGLTNLFTLTIPFLVIAVGVTVIVIWMSYAWQQRDGQGEPFAFFAGISVWPTEAIRLFVGLLCIHLLWRAPLRTRENDRKIGEEFFGMTADADLWGKPVWPIFTRQWDVVTADGKRIDAKKLWDAYQTDGTPGKRLARSVILAIAFYAIILLLLCILGFPSAPCRGDFCRRFDTVNTYWFSLPLAVLLTFFVIDGTYLNCRFIKKLTSLRTNWSDPASPTSPAYTLCADRGMNENDLNEYLDIQLIARRTAVVGEWIYYPLVVLFLLILARLSYFDNWEWSGGVVVAYGLAAVFAMVSALVLRHAAEEARRNALDALRQRLVCHLAKADSAAAESVRETMSEIESERRAAFSVLSQHPFLAAILLPSGGIGIWALLEYFAKTVF